MRYPIALLASFPINQNVGNIPFPYKQTTKNIYTINLTKSLTLGGALMEAELLYGVTRFAAVDGGLAAVTSA